MSTLNDQSAIRLRIIRAVVEVLAEQGVGRLTHRRVSAAGNFALSATSYHFNSKQQMLDNASQFLLDDYVTRFQDLADRISSQASLTASSESLSG